jgi:Na+-translocating ferredoxin:NAD+ oxidoreductase RNF subunit RnfB
MTLRSRSLRIDPDRCRGHMACMRLCPTEALRVRQGKAHLLPGRCIDCGLCIRACPGGAISPRLDSFSDFARFRHTVAIPSPALFSQFGREISPAQILAALGRAGFHEVVDMSGACEAVLLELKRVVAEQARRRPLLSPFCPTVVRLIQVRYPDLVELIAPVESPQEILAEVTRARCAQVLGLRHDQIGVIYITPCSAKMADLRLHTRRQPSHFDGAIAISHLYGHLQATLSARSAPSPENLHNGVTRAGLGWALLGGQGGSLDLENSLAVGGLDNVIRTLDDIEKGKLRDIDYVECRSCREGCIDGCLTIENLYEARSKTVQMIRQRRAEIDPDRPPVRALTARRDLLRTPPVTPRPPQALDADVAQAIEKMSRQEELHQRLPQIDCGGCGAPTCRAFAEDVVQGRLDEKDCVFLLQGRLRRTVTELSSILDEMPQPTSHAEEDRT